MKVKSWKKRKRWPDRRDVRLQDLHWSRFAAVVPYYKDNGRTASIVYYRDGSRDFTDARCERVLEELAVYWKLTLDGLQRRPEQLCQNKNRRRMPLVLTENISLIPLKCREENYRNTGTLGYWMKSSMYHVQILPDGTTLILLYKEHKGIAIPQRWETVMQQIKLCEQLEDCYKSQMRLRRICHNAAEYGEWPGHSDDTGYEP